MTKPARSSASSPKAGRFRDDGLTYTFTLRDGVKFSDGSDLTSEDVKASFEGAIENLGAYNGSYGKLSAIIASMDTPDDATFVMKLSQPYYGVLNDLTMCVPMAVVNSEAFADGNAGAFEYCMDKTNRYTYRAVHVRERFRQHLYVRSEPVFLG